MLNRYPLLVTGAVALSSLSGCAIAPSVDIFGSFFPIWMLCLAIGVGLTALLHRFFRRAQWPRLLGPRVVIYPSLVGLITFTVWLLFFR